MSLLAYFRTKVMLFKQYIGRTTTYLSVINAGMILFLFLSRLKDAGVIFWDLDRYTLWIFTLGIILLLIVGWIEIKYLRGVHEENTISFSFTPPFVEMKEKIDEMYSDFKKRQEVENAGN
jgi:hypothetical protein